MTPQTTEQRLVQVLLRAAQTALRVRRADGAGTAARDEADAALQLSFAPVWARVPQVDLEVTPTALRYDGSDVLTREDDAAGMIEALAGAGIRTLTLLPGAELEEIKLVLSAIAAPGNLLTALFRADLNCVQHSLDDETEALAPPDSAAPAPATTPEVLREVVRSDAAAIPGTSGIVQLEKFDSTLYFLDEKEIEYLKSAIDREYAQDLALNASAVLLDILEVRGEAGVRDEVIGVIEDLLTELLAGGRFEAVAYLVSGVREATREATDLTESDKARLDRLRVGISHPRALSQLLHALEGGAVHPTSESMGVLLRELRPEAIRQLLAWSEKLSDVDTRGAVTSALDAFFTEWPHGLSRMLNAPEREVVQAGLQLAARLKHPEFGDLVGEITAHAEATVRRSVAETLAAIGTATALRRLTPMAEDRDRDVRVVVFQTLSARPFRPAFGTLQRAIGSPDLETRGQREKRALFEAFGGLAGSEGVAVLDPLLRGRNPSGPRPSSHTRACAAIALGIIGTPDARAALKRFTDDKDPLVRSAVGAALRGDA